MPIFKVTAQQVLTRRSIVEAIEVVESQIHQDRNGSYRITSAGVVMLDELRRAIEHKEIDLGD